MTTSSTVDRLALLPTLTEVPRAQLEWLTANGETRSFEDGAVIYSLEHPEGILRAGDRPGLFVVLAGRLSVRRADGAGAKREIRVLTPGSVSGLLPYSRLTKPAGYILADGPVEILLIAAGDLRRMTCDCYEFTAFCVHEMLDRARVFRADDLLQEKLASLGRLSAGIAHELNNPSSAIIRSAREMDACRRGVVAAARALGAAAIGDRQAIVEALESATARPADETLSALARADREDSFDAWLSDREIRTISPDQLASTGLNLSDLDAVAEALPAGELVTVLRYVVSNATAMRLTAEIDTAARRIHSLVAAVKTHTHMDRAPAVEPVALEAHLRDTLTLARSKARGRGVTLTLTVDPDLPAVDGVAGELNQVWLNLLDNAIDAAPDAGQVSIMAACEGDAVVVRVVDDGAGISESDRDRIFDPFFTTKSIGHGSGLGLDIVRTIVSNHRGWIDVVSRPGRTEFRVSIPAAPAGSKPTVKT